MTFIIAEMSANHGGSIDKAKEMIKAAQWAGCHAVKFQLYTKKDLPKFDAKLHCEMGPMIFSLNSYCQANKIPLVLSIFGWWAVEYLKDCSLYALKFASPESTRLPYPLYERMARRIRELKHRFWVSSGEFDWALMATLNADLMFFCPPGHPAELTDQNIRRVQGRGFSDHTVSIIHTLAAVKAGATHIEKHFMLDSDCVDAEFSINPDQMKMLCDLCS